MTEKRLIDVDILKPEHRQQIEAGLGRELTTDELNRVQILTIADVAKISGILAFFYLRSLCNISLQDGKEFIEFCMKARGGSVW